ncbi:tRNA nucleotidyltransferase/poly(A) polymerase [Symmachiella macrocystis]|uniref:tRNA nucleotidyltransferase/poly(A) polymerase n=1 Tax=Symmachiella macrocystis TaxID=2527985 RepID=A0A5C6B632_9PLAN|nr:CCA tRNA nucleotidyltransferase [Symmachiella macrocystis]TWU06779.1 tRNA nucleotidyltransferase/poly(A) polymerase [Symmachiella macrocystis]
MATWNLVAVGRVLSAVALPGRGFGLKCKAATQRVENMTTSNTRREFALYVARELHEAGYQALWAGGCVRDALLGREPSDYDVATNARPDEVRKVFGRHRTVPVGASFGVMLVTAPRSEDNVEVATFRKEGPYLDGRRPDSVQYCTPEEDARRRDFTINGMFYDPLKNEVLDFVGGQEDLRLGIVRAIGDAHHRITEDKLRMLRAVRIAATLEFTLDPATAAAIAEMATEIAVVSVERIFHELARMLVCPRRVRALESLRELGLLRMILPEIIPNLNEVDSAEHWGRTLRMLAGHSEMSFELAFAILLREVPTQQGRENDSPAARDAARAEVVEQICRRLKLSNQQTERICWLVQQQHVLRDAPQLPLHALKRLLVKPGAKELLMLNRVAAVAAEVDLTAVEFTERFYEETPADELNPPELINGGDLIAAGLSPGPGFKEILDSIRDRQLDVEITTREAALTVVNQLITGKSIEENS